MEIAPRITVDPDIVNGAAVISGTRIPVSIIVGSLAGGMTPAEITRAYEVSKEDIEAALAYAADALAHTAGLPLARP